MIVSFVSSLSDRDFDYMNRERYLWVKAGFCMTSGMLLKNISPELGLTIFLSSFYFLEKWKHYQLHRGTIQDERPLLLEEEKENSKVKVKK